MAKQRMGLADESALDRDESPLHQRPTRNVSIGSVEGIVQTVSVSESNPSFTVIRSLDGRVVRCALDDRRHLDTVLEALRLKDRVLVAGLIVRQDDGSPIAVTEVREIHLLGKTQPPPRVQDLVGIDPDLTEGLPGEEWLRRRRG